MVRAEAGVEVGYVEQLYTFGDLERTAPFFDGPELRSSDADRREARADDGLDDQALASKHGRVGVRQVAVAYLALGPRFSPSPGTRWSLLYGFLPWEDRRSLVQPWPELDDAVLTWAGDGSAPGEVSATRSAELRRERADIAFGLRGVGWDEERTLERFELLYELGMAEARAGAPAGRGEPMGGDHRRILATSLGRIRGKVKYRPVIFELVPERFTLNELQEAAEALAGVRLHTANFRRLVARTGLVEATGERAPTGGRPAELFRFRREVLRERTAPGVGLPGGASPG
jgi:hypothetical protein